MYMDTSPPGSSMDYLGKKPEEERLLTIAQLCGYMMLKSIQPSAPFHSLLPKSTHLILQKSETNQFFAVDLEKMKNRMDFASN